MVRWKIILSDKQHCRPSKNHSARLFLLWLVFQLCIISGLTVNASESKADNTGNQSFGSFTLLSNNSISSTDFFVSENSVSLKQRKSKFIHPVGIGINVWGPTLNLGSVFIQYGIIQSLYFEVGVDLSTIYGGCTYFPVSPQRQLLVDPYMGLFLGYSDPAQVQVNKGIYGYMPVGVRYLHADKWIVSAEIGVTTSERLDMGPFFIGVKLGYLFRKSKPIRK